MKTYPRTSFKQLRTMMAKDLMDAPEVDVGEWHSQKVTLDVHISREITAVIFELDIPANPMYLQQEVAPNLPWAEDHFRERVSGEPLNPPPSEAWWPFAQQGNAMHKDGQKFSHTYPERYWPKQAGGERAIDWRCREGHPIGAPHRYDNWHFGVRFQYGDLGDVVNQLRESPATRQAYLPVWFPEDTGAVHKERVPCSLGYHFMVRRGYLNVSYFIRSCDFVRHFTDDVYMTGRLLQWVASQIDAKPGTLTMFIGSFHIFNGDLPKMQAEFGG